MSFLSPLRHLALPFWEKIARVAVLIIALVLCYILYVATHTEVAVPAAIVEMNTGVAVSTVVGTIIVLVATLPDFGSFVHNRKHALIAAGVTFLVAYPLLYWAGATPSAISGQGSLLGAMAVFGAVLPAALLLIFACVTLTRAICSVARWWFPHCLPAFPNGRLPWRWVSFPPS